MSAVYTAAAVGVGSVVAGVYGANKASKSADNQARIAERQGEAAADLGNRQADLAEEQWGYYKDIYQPGEKALNKEAFSAGGLPAYKAVNYGTTPLAYDKTKYGLDKAKQIEYFNDPRVARAASMAGADVASGVAGQERQALRGLAERGMNLTPGALIAMKKDLGVRGAAATAGASNRARLGEATRLEGQDVARQDYYNNRDYARTIAEDARMTGNLRLNDATNWDRQLGLNNIGFARKVDALSLGKGLPANASSGLANAANTMQSVGGTASNMAGIYGNQANQGAQLATTGLSSLAGAFNKPVPTGQGAPIYEAKPVP